MPIPGPGVPISMNTIATEFGGTVPHSLSEYYRGGGLVPNSPTNTAIPTSGQISMGNFYGAANRVSIPIVLSSPQVTYDVYTNRGPTYVPGASDITVTVNPGVSVSAVTGTGTYAMLVPNAFNPADTVTIVNQGTIIGAGGPGGTGGPAGPPGAVTAGAGVPGGNALFVNRPTTIQNPGTIAAGGGGGGGGGGAGLLTGRPKKAGGPLYQGVSGGGGGGGAGDSAGAGGARIPGGLGAGGANGNPGTSTTGGSGGAGGPTAATLPGATVTGGAGGPGGGRGASGTTGTSGSGTSPGTQVGVGGGGGNPGNYIVGNPFVTWPVTGTRLGAVA